MLPRSVILVYHKKLIKINDAFIEGWFCMSFHSFLLKKKKRYVSEILILWLSSQYVLSSGEWLKNSIKFD